MVPPFVPFAQTFAAAITAALTGSLYYIATAPKGEINIFPLISHLSYRACMLNYIIDILIWSS
jgi:hypothetical protein